MTDFVAASSTGKRKKDAKVAHESPTENLVEAPGIKVASLNVNDLLNSNSTSNASTGSTLSFGIGSSMNGVFLEQESFEDVLLPFPSLEPKHKRNAAKRRKRDPTPPMHQMSTSSAMLSIALKNAAKPPKLPLGRPRKPVPENPEPKRPVGRPRIHPQKDAADPNKPKRVPKGDKPLGRPRTSHLKPKLEVRPRGRPRKSGNGEASEGGSADGSQDGYSLADSTDDHHMVHTVKDEHSHHNNSIPAYVGSNGSATGGASNNGRAARTRTPAQH